MAEVNAITEMISAKAMLSPLLAKVGTLSSKFETICELMRQYVNSVYRNRADWDSDYLWILNQLKLGASEIQKDIMKTYEMLKDQPKVGRDEELLKEAKTKNDKVVKQLSYYRDKIADYFFGAKDASGKKSSTKKAPDSSKKAFMNLKFEDILMKTKDDFDKAYQKELKGYSTMTEEQKFQVENSYRLYCQMYDSCINCCGDIRKLDDEFQVNYALNNPEINAFIRSSLPNSEDNDDDYADRMTGSGLNDLNEAGEVDDN